ncbi:PepSY domain-containing protein [Kangiella sp.]|uniref:PepSY domain-containing protein n=1 Tax=Kangiella sp. TaxID=1920245 RepID=UPI0019CEA2A5|nr:PepSY domain-containing protein [Kangiella sp.]MBD3652693.1 PepSY domain-containing protein [Kangiella sp.]
MKYILIVILAMSALMFQSAEAAGIRIDTKVEREEQAACVPIGKSAAMSAVARKTDGRVLSASLNMNRKPPVYRVKVLSPNGRVSHVLVNACNGRVIR